MNIRKTGVILFSVICMVILILDTRTAVQGAAEGIDICVRSLIPSLFPFFIFSAVLTSSLIGRPVKILHPLAKLCRIPNGASSLLIIGFLGGYPVGAQNVALAWNQGYLSRNDACRMAAFCSNAGPAFIFGFLGQMFQRPFLPYALWLIHISSALITGFLLPGGGDRNLPIPKSPPISLPKALDISLRVMARVCGWVILFRILLKFLQRWLFWMIPVTAQMVIIGILELSNGCLALQNLASDGLRLILAAVFLGFGGLCVYLQTHSIAQGLPLSFYLPGKLLQGTISFLLAYGVQHLILPDDAVHISPYILAGVLLTVLLAGIILRNLKKPVAISGDLLYNEKSCKKRRFLCCFEGKSSAPAPTASMAPN